MNTEGARIAETVPSKRAVLDSITYLERTLWPSVNETVKAHLAGIRQFVVAAHIDGGGSGE